MKKRFILALTAIASLMANAASIGCIVAFIDEPTMPKSML